MLFFIHRQAIKRVETLGTKMKKESVTLINSLLEFEASYHFKKVRKYQEDIIQILKQSPADQQKSLIAVCEKGIGIHTSLAETAISSAREFNEIMVQS